MAGKRILILTASHLCRNPRVIKEATTLGNAGYDVTVLTVSVSPRFEQMDLELIAPLPFRRVTLNYAGSDRMTRLRNLRTRASTWLARELLRWTRIESPQALGPARPLLAKARAFPADLTIVHTEIPIWAAKTLIQDGRRVAVDVEDWYSQDLLFADRITRPLRLLHDVESFVLKHAVYASATSDSMGSALAEAYGCPRPITLRNTFPLQPRTRLDRPPTKDLPSFIWFSQTIGPGRGLELFFAAWNRMDAPSRVFLLGDERPGYRAKLLSRLSPERRSRVNFIPLVTPEQLPFKLAEFDLGLALEPHWPVNRNVTIANKIFQYMNAGLALVVTDTAGQREVMRTAPRSGLLVAARETSLFARQMSDLVRDPIRLREMQAASRAAAEAQFSWEREEPRLLEAVARALNAPLRRS